MGKLRLRALTDFLNITEAVHTTGRIRTQVWATHFCPEVVFSGDFYFLGARYKREFPSQLGCKGSRLGDQKALSLSFPLCSPPFGGSRTGLGTQ